MLTLTFIAKVEKERISSSEIMKTKYPTNQNPRAGSAKIQCPPVIPIDRGELPKVMKTNSVVFKLYTDPSNNDSPQFEMTVLVFKSRTPKEWLVTREAIKKVLFGLNLTNGPNQYQQIRRILQGDALATFNKAATKQGTETQAHLLLVLDSVTKHVFPENSLQKQKCYMCRFMRKPHELSIKEYNARLEELNSYLSWFCDEVAEATPCPRDTQQLSEDELKDILYFSIPNKWTKQAIVQGFNTLEKDRDEFVAFCERLEECEVLEGDTKPQSGTRKPIAQSSRSKRKSSSGNDSFYCMLHGADKGHDTGQCKVLQAQAKRMRGTYEARSESDRAKIRRDNRYEKKNKFSNMAELHAFINENVTCALTQAQAGIGKRKRSKNKDLQMNEEADEVSEQGDLDLSEEYFDQFNFEDLKVSDSDDKSNLDDVSF